MKITSFLFPEDHIPTWFSKQIRIIISLAVVLLGNGMAISAQEYANSQMSPVYSDPQPGVCLGCSVADPGLSVNSNSFTDYTLMKIPTGTYDQNIGQILMFPGLNESDGSVNLIIRIGSGQLALPDGLFDNVYAETYNGETSNLDRVYATAGNIRRFDSYSVDLLLRPAKRFDRVKLVLTTPAGTNLWELRVHFAYRETVLEPDANGIMYVKKGSNGNGSSWSSALGELSLAVKQASENASIKQIWVAGGTYHPADIAHDGAGWFVRHRGFRLRNNIKLYGGFAGTESTLAQRDLSISANQTILSGDMEDDDPPTGNSVGEFVFHAVVASNGQYLLDGFTVMRTNATDDQFPMIVDGISVGSNAGGGVVALNAQMEISNCIFKGIAGSTGAAIFAQGSTLNISNTVITGNLGVNGTAVFADNCGLTMVNTSISANKGSAIVVTNTALPANITNSIIYGNEFDEIIGNVHVSNCIVKGGYPGGANIITGDPMFVEPFGLDQLPDSRGNYQLLAGSPAVNAGDNNKIVGNRSAIDPGMMADAVVGSQCTGELCGVTQAQLAVDNSSVTDFCTMRIPSGESQLPASAQIDLGWTTQTIIPGDFIGFVISQDLAANPLDATLLGKITISLCDISGNELQAQGDFSAVYTTILDGVEVSYIGITSRNNAAFARLKLLSQDIASSLRIHGAFIWKPGLGVTLEKDLAGNPRVNSSTVDIGAYEFMMTDQTISVSDIIQTYGDADIEPGFTASSGLPVSYSSSNTSIAEVYQDAADNNKWKFRLLKAGVVTITASQPGNSSYLPAPDANFSLTILKKNITLGIKPATIITKVYDGNTGGVIAASDLEFAAGDIISNDDVHPALSSTAVIYNSPDAGTGKTISLPLASLALSGDDAGNYVIGNNTALSFSNATITPVQLSITANAQTKIYGESDPIFTYTSNGLIGNDPLSGALTRVPGENAGTYAILQGTLSAGSNYTINYNSALLTINKATQTISWNQSDLQAGCNGVNSIQLLATSNSGLPVSYTVANTDIATVNSDILSPLRGGITSITASQPGDQNYEAAAVVVKDFKYSLSGAIRQHFSDLLIFDNTSGEYEQWQWYKNGTAIPGATKAYYSETGALNGTYYVLVTDKNGNFVETCPLITNGGNFTRGIKVNPNPAKPGSVISITCNYDASALTGARLLLTTATGTQLQQITSVQPVTQLTLPANSGLYIITLVLHNGEKASVNILSK